MKKFIDKNGGTLVDVPSPTVVVSDHAEDSAEEIAAITAAVAAYLDQDPGSFMIKSFRRSGSAAWKKTSRDEQIYHA